METRKNNSRPNLDNKLAGARFCSPVQPALPWRVVLVRVVHLFFTNFFRCRIDPVIRHSRVLSGFCPSQGSRRRSHLENARKWWLSGRRGSLHLLQRQFSRCSPLFPLFFYLWCVPGYSCFVDGHNMTQELLRINRIKRIKQLKICVEMVSRACCPE